MKNSSLFFVLLLSSLSISFILYFYKTINLTLFIFYNILFLIFLTIIIYNKELIKKIKRETISFTALLVSLSLSFITLLGNPVQQTSFGEQIKETITTKTLNFSSASLIFLLIALIFLIMFLIKSKK